MNTTSQMRLIGSRSRPKVIVTSIPRTNVLTKDERNQRDAENTVHDAEHQVSTHYDPLPLFVRQTGETVVRSSEIEYHAVCVTAAGDHRCALSVASELANSACNRTKDERDISTHVANVFACNDNLHRIGVVRIRGIWHKR